MAVNDQFCIELDRFLVADLERERCLLGDECLSSTLVRRMEIGIELVTGGAAAELDWRPLHRATQAITVEVSEELATGLSAASNATGYEEQVLVAAFARSEACKPYDLRQVEFQYSASRSDRREDRILRTEAGRGNIYRASFEMPGYQLAFVSMLAGGGLSQSTVIEEALLALAREACATNAVRDVPLSDEARAFANRMISLSRRRPSRPPWTRNWPPRNPKGA
jgi:hypothetical protein